MENIEHVIEWLHGKAICIASEHAPNEGAEALFLQVLDQLDRRFQSAYQADVIRNEKMASARHWMLSAIGVIPSEGFDRRQSLLFVIGDLSALQKRAFLLKE